MMVAGIGQVYLQTSIATVCRESVAFAVVAGSADVLLVRKQA